MTVKELIEILQEFGEDSLLAIEWVDCEGFYGEGELMGIVKDAGVITLSAQADDEFQSRSVRRRIARTKNLKRENRQAYEEG